MTVLHKPHDLTMDDTITPSAVPAHPEAVAGYVGGRWPDFSTLVERFPRAHHLSIAVNAGENADCLDIETGDATPADAAAWVKRQRARGVSRPVVYASVSLMGSVLAELHRAGVARDQVRVWTAHYTFRAHRCPEGCGFTFGSTADATQYADHGPHGENVDLSDCSPTFFGPPKHRRRRRILSRPKPSRPPVRPIHPKTRAAGAGAGLGAAVVAVLHSAGVHLTAVEFSAIAGAIATLLSYMAPAGK